MKIKVLSETPVKIADNKFFELAARIVFAFSNIELALSTAIANASGIDEGVALVMLGRMDARARCDRLQSLFLLRDDAEAADLIKKIKKHVAFAQGKRNELAHGILMGRTPSDGALIISLPNKLLQFEGDTMVPVRQYTMTYLNRVLGHSLRLARALSAMADDIPSRYKSRELKTALSKSR